MIQFIKGLLVLWLGGIPKAEALEIQAAIRRELVALRRVGGSHV